MTDFVSLPELPSGSRDEPTVGATAALTTEQYLRRFYVELQAWIDGGFQTPSKFSQAYGLCGNLDGWCAHEEDDDICLEELLDEMSRSFEAAELSDIYPFNGFGDVDYKRERNDRRLYANLARLAWIKAHATPDGAERVHEQVSQPIRDASNDGG